MKSGLYISSKGFSFYLRILAALYGFGAFLHLLDVLGLRLDFNSMDLGWKIWILALLIVDAFAAIQMWRLRRSGELLFLLIVFAQLIAYIGFPTYFGDQTILIYFHIACLLIYSAFKFTNWKQSTK